MSDPRRAIIFGDYAATYDRHRPAYPAEAIDRVLGLVPVTRALEVGAGSGKATEAVAREGIELVCLEPSQGMAEVLEGKDLPGVEVVVSTFEDWADTSGEFDLIYAAQAWHWVDRATGYDRARSLLRPGGALALMWNIPTNRYDGYEDVYASHAPHLLEEKDERIKRRDTHDWGADLTEAGFRDVQVFRHTWSEELAASELRGLYSTYSDHMILPERSRNELLDALQARVESRGGIATVTYRTEVSSGLT
jgi:SAM-dependent methyltransferase